MVRYPELPPFTLRKCEVGHQILWMDFVFDVPDLKDVDWTYQVVSVFIDVCDETVEVDRVGGYPPMYLSPELFFRFGEAVEGRWPGTRFAGKEGWIKTGAYEVVGTCEDGLFSFLPILCLFLDDRLLEV